MNDAKFFFKVIFIVLLNAYILYAFIWNTFVDFGPLYGLVALAVYIGLVAVAVRRLFKRP